MNSFFTFINENYDDMKFEIKTVVHISYTDCHILKQQYKILEKYSIQDKIFYAETCTEKINDFEFGDSETIYYWDVKGESFKTIKECLKFKNINYEK